MAVVETTIFTNNAWTVLCKRYMYREPGTMQSTCLRCGDQHETEHQFLDRISMNNDEYRTKLFEPLRFLPNSPTLMNLGTKTGGTLSACFKFDVEDQMHEDPDSIMDVAYKSSRVLKAGGGVGYVLSALRPAGALVNSTHGKALGPVGVMHIYHELAKQITQGGKRDAAQMAILACDHPDIEKFIHCKDEDPDGLNTFNISVALTDDFMRTAVAYPDSLQGQLLLQMAQSAWKTGDPGCYFIDTAERANPTPWAGKLTGTNPCGEVPLLRNEPCNLGSINLGAHLRGGTDVLDWSLLKETVRLATRYLDDVLDHNTFPDPAITAAALYTRKLGLGVAGVADVLAMTHIPYDSQEAVDLAGNLAEFIGREATLTSIALASEKGSAPCFDDTSPQPKVMRNATVTCIAPTGTIAGLMNASSGIEPYFSLENTREMGDGTILIERPWTLEYDPLVFNEDGLILSGGSRYGLSKPPKVANEISFEWHVKHQAAWQRHFDLAVSKTINMAGDVTPEDILQAYIMMWQMGCKGGTVYRDGSRGNQVLKHIGAVAQGGTPSESLVETVGTRGWREALPDEGPAIRHKFEIGGVKGYFQVGLFPDGAPGEIFIEIARAGSTMDGIADWLAHEISIEFQMAHLQGVPFTVFTDKWLGRAFEPSGATSNKDIPFVTSLADYLARWFNMRFAANPYLTIVGAQQLPVLFTNGVQRGDMCPDCGRLLQFNEGCAHCICGYEKC